MDTKKLKALLHDYKSGRIPEGKLLEAFKILPYQNIECARIDHHRTLRFGFPEVVYGPGKTIPQLKKILAAILAQHSNVIITRVEAATAEALRRDFPGILYLEAGRIVTLRYKLSKKKNYIAVVCAGTSDIPVAEEGALTCEILGDRVERLYDVGVAGLHRLLDKIETLSGADCVIVAAGMEGALPSVVGGLVHRPVVAVPTSVGYGAAFGGITPLLAMLNSCTPNVAVVNIDNGFGAGFYAHLISAGK